MIIANPIYDVVFKHLMENIKIAKFLIGTLIDEPIEDLTVKPQLEDTNKALEDTKKTIEDKNKIIEELQRKLKGK